MDDTNHDYELQLPPLTLSQENEIMRDLYEQPIQFGSEFEDIGLSGMEDSVNLAPFVSPLDTVTREEATSPVTVKQEPEAVSYPVTVATGKLPCREPFAGPLSFELDVSSLNTRSCLYSNKLNKLFTTVGSHCPMKFKWVGAEKEALFLRAVPLFLNSQDLLEPVTTCMYHASSAKGINQGLYAHHGARAEHVVRAQHAGARYDTDPESERLSVVIPLDRLQPGSDSLTVLIAFACKNSCTGGMNRRQTEIIFTLENSLGSVLGRACVQFRVCSCPKRDLDKEERDVPKAVEARGEKRGSQETAHHSAKRLMRVIVKDVQAKVDGGDLIYIPVLETMAADVVQYGLGLLLAKSEMRGCKLSSQELELKKQYIELFNSNKK